MGCLKSKEKEPEPAPMTEPAAKKVDPRLPFETYRQFYNFKNSWKVVTRSLEATAKDNLTRFFKKYPQHLAMHKNLKDLPEEKWADSTAFENSAMNIFNTMDEAMEAIEKLDMAIATLQNAGRYHAKLADFDPQYFKDMEGPFIDSVGAAIGDRFNENTEKNFRLFFGFVCDHLIQGYSAAGGKPGATETNRV